MSLGCMVNWKEIDGRMVYISNFDAIRKDNSMCDICTVDGCSQKYVLDEEAKAFSNKMIITRCANFRGKG